MGVGLTHANMASNFRKFGKDHHQYIFLTSISFSLVYLITCVRVLQRKRFLGSSNCLISYLPLAHVEKVTQGEKRWSLFPCTYWAGANAGIQFCCCCCCCCQAMLLIHCSSFQVDVKKLMGDIQELMQTIFVSVPPLLNSVYDKVCVCTKTQSQDMTEEVAYLGSLPFLLQ